MEDGVATHTQAHRDEGAPHAEDCRVPRTADHPNVRELEGALNQAIAYTNLFVREIRLETVHEVLHDVLRVHGRHITIRDIQRTVAEHWKIRLTEMLLHAAHAADTPACRAIAQMTAPTHSTRITYNRMRLQE